MADEADWGLWNEEGRNKGIVGAFGVRYELNIQTLAILPKDIALERK